MTDRAILDPRSVRRRRQTLPTPDNASALPLLRGLSPAPFRFLDGVARPVVIVWLVLALALSVRTIISPIQHSVFPILAGSAIRYWNDHPLYGKYQTSSWKTLPMPTAMS